MTAYFDIAAFGVQDAVYDAVEPSVPAGWGWDLGRPGDLQNLHAWISQELDAAFPSAISGGRQRDEKGSLFIRAQIVIEGNDRRVPRDKARDFARIVDGVLGGDPTLGGLVREIKITKAEGRQGVTADNPRALVYHLNLTASYELSVARQ